MLKCHGWLCFPERRFPSLTHKSNWDQTIANVPKAWLFGVIVDEIPNLIEHVCFIAGTLPESYGTTFNQIRNWLSTSSKNLLYNSLIYSFLTYCIKVYDSTYKQTQARSYSVESSKKASHQNTIKGQLAWPRDHTLHPTMYILTFLLQCSLTKLCFT